jgi:DNA-binding transcriptional ArsR family regulator
VRNGTALQALVDLSRGAERDRGHPAMQAALDAIDDPSGETWLHLLGLLLDLEPRASVSALIEHITTMDAVRFREVLLGVEAWSWRTIVGADTIRAAARGNDAAADRLRADDRYYGGAAAAALATVLPLDPVETKRRFLTALDAYRAVSAIDELADGLGDAARTVQSLAEREGWIEAIDRLTSYRYVPEPEARRVVAMPHLAGTGLALAQHGDARLIVFGMGSSMTEAGALVDAGKALADPCRIRLLAAMAREPLHLGDLMATTDLTRSTVHHHLRILRAAGLVAVEGNARAYRYRIDEQGRRRLLDSLAGLLGTPRSERSTP